MTEPREPTKASGKSSFMEAMLSAESLASLVKYLGAVVGALAVGWATISSTLTSVRENSAATLKLQTDMVDMQKKQIQSDATIAQAKQDQVNLQKSLDDLKRESAKNYEEVKTSQKEQWKLQTETSSDVKVLLERTKK